MQHSSRCLTWSERVSPTPNQSVGTTRLTVNLTVLGSSRVASATGRTQPRVRTAHRSRAVRCQIHDTQARRCAYVRMTCATKHTMAADTQPPVDTSTKRRKPLFIAVGIIAVLAVIGGGALVWYLNQPVPDEVSIEAAVEDVATTVPGTNTQPDTGSDGLDGVWSVDTSIGEFNFEDATSSFVGFRIEEELATVGATTAVGRTPVVGGSFVLSGTTIAETIIEADMTGIVTNASRRDRAVQRALDTGTFPTATFTLTSPIDLNAIPVESEPVSANAVGELAIKGVTQTIEMPLEAQLVGDLIVIVGTVEITFDNWGIEVPTAPIVASVEDHGILEVQLFFTRG